MRPRFAVLLTLLCLAGLVAADKEAKEPPRIAYGKQIAPLLQQYCMKCHSGAKPKGSFSLDKIQGDGERKTWEKVISVLNAREMPPEGKPQPSAAERDLLRSFLDQQLAAVDCSKGRNPGRVTIRRLNRAEYNNTIRDLLGVDFKPAEDFPADDVGYGFDNIGDVLSMSPLLVEKYLAAAERIVEQALIKREGGPPVRRYQLGELQGDGTLFIQSNYRLLTDKGYVFIQHAFPQDEEYVLRVRAHGEQAGDEPVKMVFRLDGKDLLTREIKESGPRSAKVHEVKTRVTKGNHRLAAFFLNPFSDEKTKKNRQLAVTFLEVESPLSAAPPDARARLLFVTPSEKVAKEEAARRVLERFTRRAFRRPVAGREIDRYQKLFQLADKEGEPFEKAIGVAVQGILCSPHFLFRIEKDPAPGELVRTLDEHELAVRMSYFLWSTMPDEELFGLAEKGELRKNLEAQIQRMLKDEKSTALTDNFAGQWLQTRSLRTFNPDRNLFPNFDDRLRDAIIKELELFFAAVVKEDRSVIDFLDADFTYLNEPLARHYGIRNVYGQQFRRVELKETPRGGILTMAAILATTSNPTRTSPVKRGKWILENVLNAPPLPPPPDAGELSEEKTAVESASLRQRMELHRAKPACAQCHARMDAMGFAFENFDALGGWRTMDGKFPIDPAGTLPSGETVKGPGDLKKVLKGQPEAFARCLTEKMLTYALGRGIEYPDKCAIDDAVSALKKDSYKFSRLVLEIVRSDPFQKRRGK